MLQPLEDLWWASRTKKGLAKAGFPDCHTYRDAANELLSSIEGVPSRDLKPTKALARLKAIRDEREQRAESLRHLNRDLLSAFNPYIGPSALNQADKVLYIEYRSTRNRDKRRKTKYEETSETGL